MRDRTDGAGSPNRVAGIVLIATSIAIVALYLAHPADRATDFAGFVAEEAGHLAMDALVHGGFVLILGLQLACYALFSARLGWHRPSAVVALVLFGIGALIHMPSIFVDGVVTPALARHYLSVPADQLAAARPIFALCGIATSLFGPLAMLFEAAGIVAWGVCLTRTSGLAGGGALIIGICMMVALAAAMAIAPEIGMGAILGLILWPLIAGTALLRGRV